MKINITYNLWPKSFITCFICITCTCTKILLGFFSFLLLTFLGVQQTFLNVLCCCFSFSSSSAVTNEATLAASSWSTVAIKTGLFISIFQISVCGDGYCSTTTHQPLHSQSCTLWSCGWGPSTWNTGSHTPAEASWCSTIWASHSCPSTCSMR